MQVLPQSEKAEGGPVLKSGGGRGTMVDNAVTAHLPFEIQTHQGGTNGDNDRKS
jgi:hypothetical protein